MFNKAFELLFVLQKSQHIKSQHSPEGMETLLETTDKNKNYSVVERQRQIGY